MFDIEQHKSELEALCDFVGIYKKFRLVDPVTSEVYTLVGGKAVRAGDAPCYQIWNREAPCANCVSLRTCRDQVQYMKLENLCNSVLMVVSKPVTIGDRSFSLELVADVTDSMVVQDECHHEQTEVTKLIAEVNRLSVMDTFTGLYNNAYIKNKIVTLAQGDQTPPFSLLIMDIDHFKHVNDHYGHMAGDVVIQTIAAELSVFSERDGCSVGRMGGDEYSIVFENCAQSEVDRFAEEVIQAIRRHRFQEQGESFIVDVSIGTGEYIPGEDAYGFIKRVDLAMYDRKRNALKHGAANDDANAKNRTKDGQPAL